MNEAVPINNWSQFIKAFAGGGQTSTPLAQAVFNGISNPLALAAGQRLRMPPPWALRGK